jgi:signal transduction histidine kinase
VTATTTGSVSILDALLGRRGERPSATEELPASFSWALRACEALLLVVGLLALAGWFADRSILASLDRDWIPTAPNTALSLVLCGLALRAVANGQRRPALVVSAVVGLLSVVRLAEYLFGLAPSVDRWLFRFAAGTLGLAPVGRMALFTAFDLALAAAALALLAWSRPPRWAQPVAALAGAAVGSSGLTVALAYVYRSPLGYHGDHIPMALPTALGFLALGTGLVLLGGRPGLLERRRLEAALRASERRFRAIVEEAPIGIGVVSGDGTLRHANRELSRLLESLGLPPVGVDLGAAFVPAERGRLVAECERLAMRGEASFGGELALVDGSRWAGLELLGIGEREVLALLRETTDERLARALLADANAVLEERVRARTAELEARNREQQEFAYLASHDLQEPLRKVQAFGDRLAERWGDLLGEEGADFLRRMRDAAARMRRLIEDLLTFSRVTTHTRPFAPTDLDAVAREALSDLEVRLAESGGAVELQPLGGLEADGDQMRQLLQNLLANALKYHAPGRAPRVRVWAEEDPGPPPRRRLLVADDGIGFDERYLDRIFSPFQRLHGRGEYEGTGIGLAVCRRIVERHGGAITARSAPGRGATFVVTLPLRQTAGAAAAANRTAGAPVAHREEARR